MGVEKVSKELFNVEIKTTKTSIEASSVRRLIFFLAAGLISPKFKLVVTTLGLAKKIARIYQETEKMRHPLGRQRGEGVERDLSHK